MRTHQNAGERTVLIDGKTSSYTRINHRRQSSRLQRAESSWIRYFQICSAWWVYPVLSLGYRRTLIDSDLDDLPQTDQSSVLLERLHGHGWTVARTWKIVVRVFGKEFMHVGLFFIPYIVVRISQPLIVRQIILQLSNEQGSVVTIYIYAIVLFFCAVIQALLQQTTSFLANRVGIKIRNALTATIFKRLLSVKIASFHRLSTAQIINCIAYDAVKFDEACKYLHFIWVGPVEAIIIFGLLCWIIGVLPALIGYLIFVLFIFIQILFSGKFHEYRQITASYSDKRIHSFNEFIQGGHIIKMYTWEKLMEDRIRQIRQNELASIQRASRLRALNQTQCFVSTPFLALVTFGSMWFLRYPLDPNDIFTTLSFSALMRLSITCSIPITIERLSEMKCASQRIDSFMQFTSIQEQRSPSSMSVSADQQKGRILLSDATFSWNDGRPCLSSLNISVEPATLVGIVGPVGSGKSALLHAVLGEMTIINGQMHTYNSSFSYAAQSPWIFPDTLRNNVLLGRSFDEERYRNILHACCLDVDLSQFGSSGDLTMIGERGVNLSGGQKARVSLARALYADADIYLLDDPFAAVDRTVAKQIYKRCIGSHGLLKRKTRLLITHQTQFLSHAHQSIFLCRGQIIERAHADGTLVKDDDESLSENSRLTSMLDFSVSLHDTQPIIVPETLIADTVSWSLWCRLFTASPLGWLGLYLLIIALIAGEILYDMTNYWLKIGSSQSYEEQRSRPIFIYIYCGLTLSILFVDLIRSNYFFYLILQGSNRLHNSMLKGLLYTSLQFCESNPSGRIINRASKDQQVIDESFPALLFNSIQLLLMVAGSVVLICLMTPYVLLTLIILIPLFWILSRFCLQSNRELKRLESVTRSPIYTLVSSSVPGLSTIRAFRAQDHLIQLSLERIDANTRAYITMLGTTQWFNVMLNLLSCLFLLATVILVIVLRNRIEGLSSAALSLMYTIAIQAWFSWGVRQFLEAEILITSAQRIDEFAQLPLEADQGGEQRPIETPPEWPDRGTIEFRNYTMRYRLDVEAALKNLSFGIKSCEKIGIIGRTGMHPVPSHQSSVFFFRIGGGKSSLFKALFRLIHRASVDGQILIDDVDISRVTLGHLRSHLTIIPQQPILFADTLRYNLDPFNQSSDEQCLMALEAVQLKQFVDNHPAGLWLPITEAGSNLSAGQCQLICIARAILRKSRILLIDEATANIDTNTDELIQAVISNQFQDRTVLTIAHRLSTVARSDRIMVLDKGVVVNFDTPDHILHYYQ